MMQSWDVELAGMFNDRNNPKPTGITKGEIINPLPNMQISLGDDILLDMDNLFIANRIYQLTLRQGDQVILIPTTDEQSYYVIDKVGE